jgi:chemotaxis protein CheD
MQSQAVSRDRADDGLRRFLNPVDRHWHVQIMQGESYISAPGEIITTILGSCISACIRDPQIGVGGMNHFLLPEGTGSDRHALRFGVNAMEVLINGILKRGGSRRGLEAKLFGGANVMASLSSVGSRNAAFARQYLADEGIAVIGGSMGGVSPRRIQYWPASGRARQLAVRIDNQALAVQEMSNARPVAMEAQDVELF